MAPRIVVGVDGSEHSRRALDYAVEEATRRGAVVEAVIAFDPLVYYPGMEFGVDLAPPREKLEAEARASLMDALGEHVPEEVEVEPVVAEGSAPRVLLDRSEGAELLVVGTRGHGGFTGLLLGSTSHQVVSHAPCPVVVVPASR